MQASDIPFTADERRLGFLAFASVVGGGLIAFEAAKSIRDGDLFGTDEIVERPRVGAIALGAGFAFLGMSLEEASKTVGWKPLLLGSTAIAAVAFVVRKARG